MEERRVVPLLLSPARAATRERLIDAAIELATEGGYDDVGLRQVAARAGVSVPTVYQHVGSKDQILVEALMSLGARSTARVRDRQPEGRTPAERMALVFAKIMREVRAKPLLHQALYRAFVAYGSVLATVGGTVGFGPERAQWIEETIRAGDVSGHTDAEIDSVSRILATLFLGSMIGVVNGRDPEEAVQVLDEATHRLLS